MLIAFCVTDRLADDSMTITRSASRANTRIFEKRAIWSTPAFVRESDAKIMPASSDMATQYVMRKRMNYSSQHDDHNDDYSPRRLIGGHEERAVHFVAEPRHMFQEIGQIFVEPEIHDVVGAPVVNAPVHLAGHALDV